MLLIANNLEKNGGSTFLIRYLQNMPDNENINNVLVLNRRGRVEIEETIRKYCTIFYLDDFLYPAVPKYVCRFYVLNYWFVDFKKFFRIVKQDHFHFLGIFGFIFALFANRVKPLKLSIGIYHVNELVFKTRNIFLGGIIKKMVTRSVNTGFIFFNNFCQHYYEEYFNQRFRHSIILPIGVAVSTNGDTSLSRKSEIISVGNLVAFKTYNEHVIRCMPELLKKFDLKYVIYGSGEHENYLKKIVAELSLKDHVLFKGNLPYHEFVKTVRESKLFVGNGTAVLEAASAGIVAITGIDSYTLPETYGFVSDIVGYDYNEYDETKTRYPFYQLIEKVFTFRNEEYDELALQCKEMVRKFDIHSTIKGFEEFELSLPISPVREYNVIFLMKITLVFFAVGVLDSLNITRNFRYRRNQGNAS